MTTRVSVKRKKVHGGGYWFTGPQPSGGGKGYRKTIPDPISAITDPVSDTASGMSMPLFVITDGKTSFENYYPPKNVDYSGHESTYNEVARPDRKPLLRRSGKALRKMSMTMVLLPKKPDLNDRQISIDDRLENLETLAASDSPITVEYDPRTHGKWSITSLTYTSIERVEATNHISRAEVTIEFTENPNPTKVTINDYSPKKRPKYYTVKKNDTLAKIAQRFYGTDSAAIVRAIAKVNDIDNPKHIKAGRKIKLP